MRQSRGDRTEGTEHWLLAASVAPSTPSTMAAWARLSSSPDRPVRGSPQLPHRVCTRSWRADTRDPLIHCLQSPSSWGRDETRTDCPNRAPVACQASSTERRSARSADSARLTDCEGASHGVLLGTTTNRFGAVDLARGRDRRRPGPGRSWNASRARSGDANRTPRTGRAGDGASRWGIYARRSSRIRV